MAELRLQTAASGRIPRDSFTLGGVLGAIEGEGLAWLDILRPEDEV